MNPRTVRAWTPKICAFRECLEFIKPGRAMEASTGHRLFHPDCSEMVVRVFPPNYYGKFIEVELEYTCPLPKDPVLYLLERLPVIKPFESIAAKLEPKKARKMYMALSNLYPEIIFGSRQPDELKISSTSFEYLAAFFTPQEDCILLKQVEMCAALPCAQPIGEGPAEKAKNGDLYHPLCSRDSNFELGTKIEPEKVVVKYVGITPPTNHYYEFLMGNEDIAALHAIFASLGDGARDAFLAVAKLIEMGGGVSGANLQRLSEKYRATNGDKEKSRM